MSLQSLALRFYPGLRASLSAVGLFSVFFFSLPKDSSPCVKVSASPVSSCLPLSSASRACGHTHTHSSQKIFYTTRILKTSTNKWLRFSAEFEYQAALFSELETPRVNYSYWYVFITSSWEYRWDQASFTSVLIQFGRQLLPALVLQVFSVGSLCWQLCIEPLSVLCLHLWFLLWWVQSGDYSKYKVSWESLFLFIWNCVASFQEEEETMGEGKSAEVMKSSWSDESVFVSRGKYIVGSCLESDLGSPKHAWIQSIYLATSVGSGILTITDIHLNKVILSNKSLIERNGIT